MPKPTPEIPPARPAAARADLALVLGALRAVAARPSGWEQVIDALGDPAGVPIAEMAAPLLEPPGVGVVMVSAAGAVCAWNPAGEAVLLDRLGAITVGSALHFSPVNHEALAQARQRLEAGVGPQVIVKFTTAADEAPCFAYVTPAEALPAPLQAGVLRIGDEVPRLAMVFPAVDASDRLWANLRRSFGLTVAETRLAAKLKEGLSLKEAAAALGVSFHTVRNQLRAVFDKVGLTRQSDLVKALTDLGGLAGALSADEPIAATEGGAVRAAPPLRLFGLGDRRMAWREYGDPRGRPALVVHQGLGCSVLPRGTDSLARDLGLRLICADRPGAGRSEPHPEFSFEAVAADMAALCRSLELRDLRIVGFMAGAPFALCLAAELGEAVSKVMLASARPSGQTAETEADRQHRMVLFRRRLLRNSWLSDLMFALLRRQLSRGQVERFVRTAASAPSDAAYLADHPGVVGYICEYIAESLALTSRGIADEVKCAARNSTLDLAGLTAPISVWHGADDPMATATQVVEWLGGRVAETRQFPDVGHFMPLRQWPEILGWLAE